MFQSFITKDRKPCDKLKAQLRDLKAEEEHHQTVAKILR
jgi:hypothetical protein